jgi:hypothetical protein
MTLYLFGHLQSDGSLHAAKDTIHGSQVLPLIPGVAMTGPTGLGVSAAIVGCYYGISVWECCINPKRYDPSVFEIDDIQSGYWLIRVLIESS